MKLEIQKNLKNYEYIEHNEIKRALKGVPKNALEVRPNVWHYENLTKTKEALRRNIEAGIKIKRTKVISEIYDKRIVLKRCFKALAGINSFDLNSLVLLESPPKVIKT